MSDHAAAHDAATATLPEPGAPVELFTPAEIQEFDDDDVKAGGNIGRMLAILFIYTVFAMSVASYWTWRSISH